MKFENFEKSSQDFIKNEKQIDGSKF